MYVLYHLVAFAAAEMIKIIPVCDAECQKNMLLAKYYPAPNMPNEAAYCIRGVDVRTNKKCVVGVRGVVAKPADVKHGGVSVNPPPEDVIVSTYYKTVTVTSPTAASVATVLPNVKPSQIVYHSKNVTNSIPAAKIVPEKAPPVAGNVVVAPSVHVPAPIPAIKNPPVEVMPPKTAVAKPTVTVTQPPLIINRPVVQTVTVSQPPIVVNKPIMQTVTVSPPPTTVNYIHTVTISSPPTIVSAVQTVTVSSPPATVNAVQTVTVTVATSPQSAQTVTKEIRIESKPGAMTAIVKQPDNKKPPIEISTPISSTVSIKKPDIAPTSKNEPVPVYPAYPQDYSNYYAYYGYGDPRAYYPYDRQYGYYGNYYPPAYSYPGSTMKISKESKKLDDDKTVSKYKIVKNVDPAQAKQIMENEKKNCSDQDKNGMHNGGKEEKDCEAENVYELEPDAEKNEDDDSKPSYAPKEYPEDWGSDENAKDDKNPEKTHKKRRGRKHGKKGHRNKDKARKPTDNHKRHSKHSEPSVNAQNLYEKEDSKYTTDFQDEYNDSLPREIRERQPHVNEPPNINKYLYDRIYKKMRNKNMPRRINFDDEKNREEKLKDKYNSIIYLDEQDKMLRNKIFKQFIGERGLNQSKPVRRNGDEIELSDSFSAVVPEKKVKGDDENSSSDEIVFLSELLK
ncbi:hypothetical protein THOM_0773 [Trachipleistophora hominis]|uniref:Uncharacterized protein n=1 Tax=Trachipleistophora hominis TaxID=72359 RepID=L7JZU6_TRAHO|nr:hypothetical protein THOM_0773 [Trachipleistophora hominis]